MHLGVEGEPVDADAALQRKWSDAWAVNWDKRCLLILEFTRPNDRCKLSLSETLTHTSWHGTHPCETGWRGFFLDGRE